MEACRAAGFEPATTPDPNADLGMRAVRDGLGVVLYPRSSFPPRLEGSVLLALDPPVPMPFALAWVPSRRSGAVQAVLEAARHLADAPGA